jgi:hypothetical protein
MPAKIQRRKNIKNPTTIILNERFLFKLKIPKSKQRRKFEK